MLTSTLSAGSAVVDITPPHLHGLNAMGDDFVGIHDRLFARALVLESSGTRVAIVSADLLELGVTVALRQRIAEETGIAADAVLLVASHSHNSPRAGRTPAGGLSRVASTESLAYTDWLFDRLVESVSAALATVKPACLGFGRGEVDVNVNRDVLVDGAWKLGQSEDGPSDKTLGVIAVRGEDGTGIATLIDYAVHPTAALGTRLLSADVAGAAARILADECGGVALWLPGSIGDQAIRTSFESLSRGGAAAEVATTFDAVERQGRTIADVAAGVVAGIEDWRTDVPLRSEEQTLEWTAKAGSDLPPDMVQEDVAVVALRLLALTLGDVSLVGVGGEVTTAAAARILEACDRGRGTETFLVSIANERVGYLADADAFARGTFAARGCPVTIGWEDGAARTLSAMLEQAGVAR